MASRQLGSGLMASLRSWTAVALGSSGGAASSSGGWAARLEEALTKPFLGTRDGKTRRGKVRSVAPQPGKLGCHCRRCRPPVRSLAALVAVAARHCVSLLLLPSASLPPALPHPPASQPADFQGQLRQVSATQGAQRQPLHAAAAASRNPHSLPARLAARAGGRRSSGRGGSAGVSNCAAN